MFRLISHILMIWALVSAPVFAQSDDPYVFVKSVATATFAQIKQDQQLIQSQPSHIQTIVEQQLMPHIDHVYAALSVIGTPARDIPKEKLDAYYEQFRLYLITTYASALQQYTNQIVEFEPSKALDGRKTVAVKAYIKEPGKPTIDLTFQVRRNKEGQWKAYDLIAEGISMVQSKRSEFAPILRQRGIDAVITFMHEQSQKSSIKTKS
ncbi:MlaC/ttg2D family ABC transporter substrate-binding protein [Paraglaciecola aestuariivivens]